VGLLHGRNEKVNDTVSFKNLFFVYSGSKVTFECNDSAISCVVPRKSEKRKPMRNKLWHMTVIYVAIRIHVHILKLTCN